MEKTLILKPDDIRLRVAHSRGAVTSQERAGARQTWLSLCFRRRGIPILASFSWKRNYRYAQIFTRLSRRCARKSCL